MKSRLEVSLLFILIASTFASDATGAFEELRSWTGKVCGRCAVQVCNRLTPRYSALMSAIKGSDKDGVTMIHLDGDRLLLRQNCATADRAARVVGTISPDGKTITFDPPEATKLVSSQEGHTLGVVFKLVDSGYHSAFEYITTAARQIHEVLGLMRIK